MPIWLYAGNPAPSTDQGPPWPQDRGRPRPGVVLGPKGTPSVLGPPGGTTPGPEDQGPPVLGPVGGAHRPPWPQDRPGGPRAPGPWARRGSSGRLRHSMQPQGVGPYGEGWLYQYYFFI